MKPWVKWLVNRNMKFVIYLTWFLILPCYLFWYCGLAMEDATKNALDDFNAIKNTKKDNL